MAIDTRDKRGSALHVALPFVTSAPLPDGDITSLADRQDIAGGYRGVLADGLPLLVDASVITNGTEIRLTFTEVVNFGAGGNGGFALTASGGASTMTYDSGAGTRYLVYTLSRAIDSDETVTVDYTQPGDGVIDVDTNELASFSGEAVNVGISGPGYAVPINSFIQYVQYGTADVGSVTDAWVAFLRDQGYNGALNSMQFEYLRDEGYEGSLADMLTSFKSAQDIK